MSTTDWRAQVDAQMTRELARELAREAETPAAVFGALLETYRQAGQDHIHATWGESWPTHKAREAAELRALRAECDRWAARFAAAERGGRR